MTRMFHPQVAGAAIANRAFPRLLATRRWIAPAAAPAMPRVQEVERTLTGCHPLLDSAVAFTTGIGRHSRLVVAVEVTRQLYRVWEEDLSGELNPLLDELTSAIRRIVNQRHRVTVSDVVLLATDALPTHADRDAARDECRQAYLARTLPRLS